MNCLMSMDDKRFDAQAQLLNLYLEGVITRTQFDFLKDVISNVCCWYKDTRPTITPLIECKDLYELCNALYLMCHDPRFNEVKNTVGIDMYEARDIMSIWTHEEDSDDHEIALYATAPWEEFSFYKELPNDVSDSFEDIGDALFS